MLRPLRRKLLSAAFLVSLLAPGAAAEPVVPQYTITQLFKAGERSKEIRFGKEFSEHAVITSPSYRVTAEQVRFFYGDGEFGPLIRGLLREDPIVRFEDVDRFLGRNLGRIRQASFYREGFVTLQLEKPQTVMIIPFSLVTVRKSEELIRKYLKIRPELFQ
jgi:hypothetical protein